MSLFILFCVQFVERIFEDILFVSSGINWLISDVWYDIFCRIFQHHFLRGPNPNLYFSVQQVFLVLWIAILVFLYIVYYL